MSTDRDVTRIVRSWLEDGAQALPDRVLDNVLDQLPATPQRRAWWPAWRFREMNNFAKFAIAAAAVAVIAIVGIYLLPRSGGVARPGPSTTPAPSVSPAVLRDGPLPAGAYEIDQQAGSPSWFCQTITPQCRNTVRVTLTVPDGWAGIDTDSIWLATEQNAAPTGAGLGFTNGAPLHADPCLTPESLASDGTMIVPDIPVGPTVDDFATALADHRLLDTTTPVDVTLAGYSGKYMDLQVPADITACPTSYWPWEPGLYAQGPSQRWHLWILDVAGQRVVVQSTDYAGTSPERRAELQAIVDSLQIRP